MSSKRKRDDGTAVEGNPDGGESADGSDNSDTENGYFDVYGPEVSTSLMKFLIDWLVYVKFYAALFAQICASVCFPSWQGKAELVFNSPETTLNLQVGFGSNNYFEFELMYNDLSNFDICLETGCSGTCDMGSCRRLHALLGIYQGINKIFFF